MASLLNMSGSSLLGKSGLLPSGYKQLEYIESTGNQYIDTGVVGHLNTSYEICFMVTQDVRIGILFGSRSSATQNSITTIAPTRINNITEGVINDFGNYRATRQTYDGYTKNVIITVFNSKNLRTTYNHNTGVTYTNTSTYNDAITTPTNLYIARRTDGYAADHYNFEGRIYYNKIYEDEELVRDYIPCINPQNIVGMYDTVSQQFFGNSGTGSFIAGPEV